MATTGDGNGRQGLIEDLKLVIKDAEDLLRGTSQQVDDGYQQARARFESTLGVARDNLSDIEAQLMDAAREAVEQADTYVREKPWQAIGIGAAVGVIAGLMIGRR